MSQSSHRTPSVIMNAGNNRQQVPLRDYLNARVAPFLKKAITESLGVEAEFPLQWLGECLIHQSILYESNPDSTNIRERFLYKFEDPKPQEEIAPEPEPEATEPIPAPPEESAPQQQEATLNDAAADSSATVPPPNHAADVPEAPTCAPDPSVSAAPVVNGVKDQEAMEPEVARDGDTEMGGTS